ncbi:MAG: alanine racemase, partial [Clostridia bacterium]|nr:alanine racemase [Clostridia bacterium]
MQKTVAKINLKSIEQNAKLFKKTSGVKLCAVVKANAYGHGAQEVVNVLNTVADAFAVALIEEGISIREAAAGKDVLVLTPPTNREQAESIIDNSFIASVGDLQTANLLKKTAQEKGAVCRVHIKVNLGMNRYGVSGAALGKVCKILCATKWIKVEGMYGHLHEQTRAAAEDCRNRFLACKAVYERYFGNGL